MTAGPVRGALSFRARRADTRAWPPDASCPSRVSAQALWSCRSRPSRGFRACRRWAATARHLRLLHWEAMPARARALLRATRPARGRSTRAAHGRWQPNAARHAGRIAAAGRCVAGERRRDTPDVRDARAENHPRPGARASRPANAQPHDKRGGPNCDSAAPKRAWRAPKCGRSAAYAPSNSAKRAFNGPLKAAVHCEAQKPKSRPKLRRLSADVRGAAVANPRRVAADRAREPSPVPSRWRARKRWRARGC